jgi:hypothetical protein
MLDGHATPPAGVPPPRKNSDHVNGSAVAAAGHASVANSAVRTSRARTAYCQLASWRCSVIVLEYLPVKRMRSVV